MRVSRGGSKGIENGGQGGVPRKSRVPGAEKGCQAGGTRGSRLGSSVDGSQEGVVGGVERHFFFIF